MQISNILDTVISLSYTYFLLALIVSAVLEIINTALFRRRRLLKFALKRFFDGTVKKKLSDNPITNKICDSAFIKSTMKKDGIFPTYIDAKNISLAVLDKLDPEKKLLAAADKDVMFTNLENSINKEFSSNDGLRNMFLTILHSAEKDINKFTGGIETVFNDYMDRVTGWFKRNTQWINFAVCTVVVLLLNINTIKITQALWVNKDMRENAVRLATDYINSSKTKLDTLKPDSIKSTRTKVIMSGTDTLSMEVSQLTDSLKQYEVRLNEIGLPVGWTYGLFNSKEFRDNNPLTMIFGWLLSIIAIYLGAPFWFDTLNKFINIRGAGKKPEEDDKKSK